MTDSEARTRTTAVETKGAPTVDMKLEVVVIPVSDVDRAKEFYERLGWRLDADFAGPDDYRVIQFTPPGSPSSVIFGKNVTAAAPGSARGLYLIVSDIKAARDERVGRGAEVSEVFHAAGDVHTGTDEPYLFGRRRIAGPDPERGSYRTYASFSDPDGNGWLFQEVTARLPGRVDADHTTFTSSTELASALRRAAARTASTRSGPAGPMRTGRTGTPSTSSASRPGRSCRHEQDPDEDDASHGNGGTDPRHRLGAAHGAGSAGGNQANRPAAARPQRSRTRGRPGPRRPRSGSGVRQAHPSGEEIIYVLEGTLEYDRGKPPVTLKAGDVLFIPAGTVIRRRTPAAASGVSRLHRRKGKPLLTLGSDGYRLIQLSNSVRVWVRILAA
jgi:catechol 2,3-dioxygenase-like lactoylglutathione lyase family enzyme